MKMSEGVVPSDRRQKLLGSNAAAAESLSGENGSLQHKIMNMDQVLRVKVYTYLYCLSDGIS